jgi:hypothetical protein
MAGENLDYTKARGPENPGSFAFPIPCFFNLTPSVALSYSK